DGFDGLIYVRKDLVEKLYGQLPPPDLRGPAKAYEFEMVYYLPEEANGRWAGKRYFGFHAWVLKVATFERKKQTLVAVYNSCNSPDSGSVPSAIHWVDLDSGGFAPSDKKGGPTTVASALDAQPHQGALFIEGNMGGMMKLDIGKLPESRGSGVRLHEVKHGAV